MSHSNDPKVLREKAIESVVLNFSIDDFLEKVGSDFYWSERKTMVGCPEDMTYDQDYIIHSLLDYWGSEIQDQFDIHVDVSTYGPLASDAYFIFDSKIKDVMEEEGYIFN
jgi:hypothetical protein